MSIPSQAVPAVFAFESHSVRAIMRNNEPWFVAADVCLALEIANPTQAIQRLDDDERSMFNIGRQGNAHIINESGLYSLILGSRKPEAKRFKKWITSEVLPSLRETGSYSMSGITSSDSPGVPSPWALTHNGLPVLTVQRLAACFGLTVVAIQNYSRQHASQLIENTHYFQLTGEAQRHFRLDNRSSPDTPYRKLPVLTLWTEAGAQQLAQCISPIFATQAMPAVCRYLHAAAPATAQPDTTRPTLVTPPDGSRLLLSTDRDGNIQSEPVPLDAFVVRREELAARIATRDEIWTRAELAAILTAAANRLAG